ncbi:phage tail tape measure protein [Runella sp. CRIBMP]|uniref:phage tail tape measure protein n=1 Tax=Runella sp. CRIBMP TaxID=2683261 RepID=UPI001411EA09|nr:phage tail tape measure protein [Runella sp. CRIBMP]NBB18858.1 phage tail tape measure protein [Runella sp. CRIBMP]
MAVRKEQAIVDLVINGRAAEKSIKDIQKATFETEKLLRNMSKAANPEEYAKLQKELIKLRGVMSEFNAELKVNDGWWGKFKSNMGQIALGTLGGNIFTAIGTMIATALPKFTQKAAEYSDTVANVQKTTKLAEQQVEELFDEIKDIDTRSSTQELRDLAAMAGKLGEDTEKGAEGFVRGADVINVALKEDLGGSAEEAINKLGKLITIFDLKRQFGIEDSFIKVGSVINELGGNSAASEEYIVNFTTRLAGIAPAARISISEVMGLAAVMDEQGQSTELAATNIGKMLISLGKDIPYFSKVAGMSVKDFTHLLNTNANEALLRVVERAKQSEGGLGNLAKTFKTLGIDGTEGAAVIGALANNITRVREQQAIANREFENGQSILTEYNIKNNNSAAIWEKVTRKVEGFVSSAFKPLGEMIIRISGDLLGVTSEFDKLSEKIEAQKSKVNSLDKNLTPLLNKYESLALQAASGKDVQGELNQVVQQVAQIMPSAVTAWDSYGRAIDINNIKARNAIEDHKAMMRYLNKEGINELEQQRNNNTQAYYQTIKDLNSSKVTRTFGINSYGQEITAVVEKTDADQKRLLQKLEKIKKERVEINRTINGLSGYDKYYTGKKTSPTANAPVVTPAVGGSFEGDGGTPKEKKEVDEFKQLKEELRKLREDVVLDAKTANERELQTVKFKYDRLREMAKGNMEYITELNKLEDAELLRVGGDQAKKYEEQLKKSNEKYQEQIAEADKKATELAEKRSAAIMAVDEYAATEQQRELGAADKRFQTLLAQAEEVGLTAQETLPLWEAYWQARAAIEDKYYTEANDKANKKRLNEIEQQGQLMENIGNIYASFFEIAASNETEFAEFKKIATLIQIGADTASAISSMVAKGALTSATPLDAALKITAGIGVVLANIAKAKQVLTKSDNLEKPNIQRMPGRESGGSTDLLSLYLDNSGTPQGYVDRPTLFNLGPRSWVGGEKKKREYVFSNAMLQNPVFANFAAMAETLRTSGFDFSKNADMKNAQGSAGNDVLFELISVLIAETQRNTAAVEKFAEKPWSTRRLEDAQELLDYARNSTKA